MLKTYQTQDTALALTLRTCGVPFFRDENGNEVPYIHIYTAAVLRKLGYRGLPIEEAARQARERGQTGVIVYNFERTDLCSQIIEAYSRQSQAITRAIEGGRAPDGRLDVDPIEAARLCCQLLRNRRLFTPVELCRSLTPFVCLEGDSRTETDAEGRHITIGSFKLLPLGATDALRTHLKV